MTLQLSPVPSETQCHIKEDLIVTSKTGEL